MSSQLADARDMSLVPLARLDNCGLEALTGATIRQALDIIEPLHGQRLWREICKRLGIDSALTYYGLTELDLIAAEMIHLGGTMALAGRSLRLRTDAYRVFMAPDAPAGRTSISAGWVHGPRRTRERIHAAQALDFFNPAHQTSFDAIAERMATEADAPMSVISPLLIGVQAYVANVGIGGWAGAISGTPMEWSFCRNLLQKPGPHVVEDASQTEIERHSPFVVYGDLRAYAGAPLQTKQGVTVGSVCVADTRARPFTHQQIEAVECAAADVMALLEGE